MNEEAVCQQLLVELGGRDNIVTNDACMTRLRVSVRDRKLVDVDAIKRIDGVMGVVEADTLQVVFGPGTVNKVLAEFVTQTGIPRGATRDGGGGVGQVAAGGADVPSASSVAQQNKADQQARHDGSLQTFLRRVANVFVSLLPGVIAAGLINGITNVLNVSLDGTLSGQWWYECIRTVMGALCLPSHLCGLQRCQGVWWDADPGRNRRCHLRG